MTAGEEFVKKLRPVGCAILLIAAIAVVAICLSSGRDPIKGYAAPESTEYYAAHPEELADELESRVLPELEGVRACLVRSDGLVEIVIDSEDFAVTRSAVLRYFDADLFIFTEG